MTKKIIIFLSLFIFVSASSSYANWMDSYLQSNPSYYETQRQGYLSFGGASYRTPTAKTPFVTVTMPKVQVGCGGIDTFWGGLAYLQPEYLVQAFQNIMSAAPAFAFDIALKVLCEQCYEIKTSLESIANLVNQMAMDECGAARALVNMGANYITNKLGYNPNEGGVFHSKVLEETQKTLSQWTEELNNFYQTEFCPGNDDHLIGPCIEYASFGTLPKSFWQSLAKLEAANAQDSNDPFYGCGTGICDFVKIVEGVFGDIKFDAGGSSEGVRLIKVEKIDPKSNVSDEKWLHQLIDGNATGLTIKGQYMASNGSTVVVDVNVDAINFGGKAEQALGEIINAIETGNNTLSSSTIDFINDQVFPLWRLINIISYQGTGALSTIQTGIIKKYAAISNAYYFLKDLAKNAEKHLNKHINTLLEGANYAPVNQDIFKGAISALRHNIASFRRALTDEYRNIQKDFYSTLASLTEMSTLEKEITARLMTDYGYMPLSLYK
jgi:hypothetical protein